MKIHTKLKRLFATVAARGGTLISKTALAEAMGVERSAISQLFGHGKDSEPLNQPPHRLGELVKLFREAGIPIEMHWLYAPLDEFDRLLYESTGIDARPALSWPDAIRRYARSYDGLRLQAAAAGFRLRIEGEPARAPIDRFRIDERVSLVLELPEAFLIEGGSVFATVVHEAGHETTCLFPLGGANGGPLNRPVIRLPDGLLSDGRPRCYQVSEPAGVQRVHTVISRIHPAAAVHAGLKDIDLHMGLDRLASELSGRSAEDWNLLSLTYQVDAAGIS